MKRAKTGRFVKRKTAKAKAAPKRSRRTTRKAAPSIAALTRALKAAGLSVHVIKPKKSGKAKRSR